MSSTKTRTHVVVGEEDQVAAVMVRARETGRLVAVGEIERLAGDQVRVTAQLREPTRSRWERVRPWLLGFGWLLAVAAVAGAVWLIVLGVLALMAWVQAHLVGIVAGAALLVLLGLVLLGGAATCEGLHCGGCRR